MVTPKDMPQRQPVWQRRSPVRPPETQAPKEHRRGRAQRARPSYDARSAHVPHEWPDWEPAAKPDDHLVLVEVVLAHSTTSPGWDDPHPATPPMSTPHP